MAISFPVPEAAAQKLQIDTDKRVEGSSLAANVAHVLRRGYERVSSAIFDPDDEIVRF